MIPVGVKIKYHFCITCSLDTAIPVDYQLERIHSETWPVGHIFFFVWSLYPLQTVFVGGHTVFTLSNRLSVRPTVFP